MQKLTGMPVVNALAEKIGAQIEKLGENKITPKLAVIRVGEREDDIAYEKGILKRFSAAGAAVEITALPFETKQDELEDAVIKLNNDACVHGILLFRPLPDHLSQKRLMEIISKDKDVDGMGIVNNAYLYNGNKDAYAPCTAQAVIELFDFYGIELTGKKITVIGRSLVAGKPLSMLLLDKNATVTICHTKTNGLESECKRADILIACAGSAKMAGAGFTHSEQIIIDVGINMLEGKLCGDVDFEAVENIAAAVTPVPGGVGTVTTSVLLKNTVNSAIKYFMEG